MGFSLGLIGGGGSILATPLLLYVVGVSQPHIAISTGALAVSATAFINLASYARTGVVRWRLAERILRFNRIASTIVRRSVSALR